MEDVKLYKDSSKAVQAPGSRCEAHQASALRPTFNVSSLDGTGTVQYLYTVNLCVSTQIFLTVLGKIF